jgi:hypothetical protein
VRYYGLYANAYKKKLLEIPLDRLVKTSNKHTNKEKKLNNHLCLKCNNPLVLIEEFGKEYFYANGPPKRQVLLAAIYKKLFIMN